MSKLLRKCRGQKFKNFEGKKKQFSVMCIFVCGKKEKKEENLEL